MDDALTSAAEAALQELLDVSPQVDATLVATRDGGDVVAFRPEQLGSEAASRFGASARQLLSEAEHARVELAREPVTQVEVATGDAHVFVVVDEHHLVAAVTDADPTVGLVFYDLKTALRTIRDAAAGTATVVAAGERTSGAGADTSPGDESNGTASDAGTSPGDEPAEEPASSGGGLRKRLGRKR